MKTSIDALCAELTRLDAEAVKLTAKWDSLPDGVDRDLVCVRWLGVGQARDQVREQLASLTGDWT